MVKITMKEEHDVEKTACDICGKVIEMEPPKKAMEWYRLEYIGWLGHQELMLCSIPCAIKWAEKAGKWFEAEHIRMQKAAVDEAWTVRLRTRR